MALPEIPPQLRASFPAPFWNWWQAFRTWLLRLEAIATGGVPGTPGAGVPIGGTTGQVLAKKTNASYDTQWVSPSAGSGTLAGLSDVSLSSLVDADILQYDSGSGKWKNDAGILDLGGP